MTRTACSSTVKDNLTNGLGSSPAQRAAERKPYTGLFLEINQNPERESGGRTRRRASAARPLPRPNLVYIRTTGHSGVKI